MVFGSLLMSALAGHCSSVRPLITTINSKIIYCMLKRVKLSYFFHTHGISVC